MTVHDLLVALDLVPHLDFVAYHTPDKTHWVLFKEEEEHGTSIGWAPDYSRHHCDLRVEKRTHELDANYIANVLHLLGDVGEYAPALRYRRLRNLALLADA